MKKITILAIRNTIATTVLGPMDVFFQAGQLWNHIQGMPLTPFFDVEVVSTDGQPVRCLNNVQIAPHRAMEAVDETDLIVIPSITNIEGTIRHHAETIAWLRRHHRKGCNVAHYFRKVCTLFQKSLHTISEKFRGPMDGRKNPARSELICRKCFNDWFLRLFDL